MRRLITSIVVLVATVAPAGCDAGDRDSRVPATAPATTGGATTTTTTAATATTATTVARPMEIRYRVDRRVTDDATDGFARMVDETLTDPRGWVRAEFRFVRDDDAPFLIVLAEGAEVDRLCLPYETYGRYSCQNGPVVAINADRWRQATPQWTGDLESYRQMLINHEVGHLLGMRHPRPQCPRPGAPAAIMNQQSTELGRCLANPWPLDDEIERAARHDRKLAPGYGE